MTKTTVQMVQAIDKALDQFNNAPGNTEAAIESLTGILATVYMASFRVPFSEGHVKSLSARIIKAADLWRLTETEA